MEFAFTAEQELLRSQARAWLAERYPPQRIAELADSETGWEPESWAALAGLGWLGVSVPEADGGAGLGFLEEAVLIEELGRALYPGPYLATVVLALPVLPPELHADVAAGRTRWSAALDGGPVPDLAAVDRVVAVRGDRLVAVAARGQPVSTVDATRRFGRLELEQGEELGSAGALAAARPRVLAALALEAVGVAARALELGVTYARERRQFGRPIGAYQAVSHRLADTYVETELARSVAYWAAWCVQEGDEQAPVAAAAAKAAATEAAVAACERSIQVHGGIGFTWEHVLHRYYKRALWLEAFAGFPAQHRAAVADAVLGEAAWLGPAPRSA